MIHLSFVIFTVLDNKVVSCLFIVVYFLHFYKNFYRIEMPYQISKVFKGHTIRQLQQYKTNSKLHNARKSLQTSLNTASKYQNLDSLVDTVDKDVGIVNQGNKRSLIDLYKYR